MANFSTGQRSLNMMKATRWILAITVAANIHMVSPLMNHAWAADEAQPEQRKTRKTPALREKTYKTLSEAQEKAEANKNAEAIAILDKLQNSGTLNSYEAAMMWKFYAFIYYSQEKYDDAIRSYEKLLQQDALPEALETEALYNLSQLYFVKEDYGNAIKQLKAWFKLVPTPTPRAYILLGQAYYQKEEYDAAIDPITKAIGMRESAGKVPEETWYLLLRAIYFEKNNFAATARVLEKLVSHYPKKDYWLQLSGIYGELKQEKNQLAAMEIAYRQNMLTEEKEWLSLAQLFLYNDVPYKAAKVLETGMKKGIIKEDKDNLKLLSYAWSASQEAKKALPVLIKAAQSSDTGELDVRLGQTYFQLDEFDKAVKSFRQGIKKGELDHVDNAYLLLGLSLYNMEQFEDAQYAFKEAAKYKDSKTAANQWLNFIDKEIERRNILAETMKSLDEM